jgi:hypothetical protein
MGIVDPELHRTKPKNCGGPLICRNCCMTMAQQYFQEGKVDWAEIYRNHADVLNQEHAKKYLDDPTFAPWYKKKR